MNQHKPSSAGSRHGMAQGMSYPDSRDNGSRTNPSAIGRKTFAALGDWMEHYSYLSFEEGRFTLSFYRPGKTDR